MLYKYLFLLWLIVCGFSVHSRLMTVIMKMMHLLRRNSRIQKDINWQWSAWMQCLASHSLNILVIICQYSQDKKQRPFYVVFRIAFMIEIFLHNWNFCSPLTPNVFKQSIHGSKSDCYSLNSQFVSSVICLKYWIIIVRRTLGSSFIV